MTVDLLSLPTGSTTTSSTSPDQENVFRWATVDSVSPLRVVLDGDSDPLPFTPTTLIAASILSAGDRVWCQISGRRVIVLGAPGMGGGGGGYNVDGGTPDTNYGTLANVDGGTP